MSRIQGTPPTSSELEDADYPSSDGKPMAETTIHGRCMRGLSADLEDYVDSRGWTDCFVGLDNFWYFERHNIKRRVAPDVYVVQPVSRPKDHRTSWQPWNEGGASPNVVFEMASRATVKDNLERKRRLYRRLGVKEYFIYDPTGSMLPDFLRGFRLSGNRYRVLKKRQDGSMQSKQLGVRLRPEGELLRLIDATTGERILTRLERLQMQQIQLEAAAETIQTQQTQLEQTAIELEKAQATIRELLARLGQSPPSPS